MEDQRFQHVMTDPKFRRIPKKEQKIKIDKRFQSMFKDNKFKVKYTTDKRGRPISHTSTEDLKRYYELSSEDESSESDRDPVKVEKSSKTKKKSDLNLKHTSDKALSSEIKKKLKNLNVDYARGEAVLYSESSSDDEDIEAEVSENEEIEHKWGELDVDAEQTEEVTYRLAACNMNWDRIRAVDLMVLFNSFLPSGGVIKSVVIYLSEFGKARMQEEEMRGPIELVELKKTETEDDDEEGSAYHMEKLRQYQLNRLKYYYAVITFDSVYSANKIYTECDGMEYESSAIKLDLRFIPDDMEFNEDPKEICDKLPEVNKYEPRFFTTTALQQAKVDLTWDETNPDRIEIAQKLNSGKVDDITDADLQNYLASSSDEEDDLNSKTEDNLASDEENSESGINIVDKYKALLQDIEEKEKSKNEKVEMEISWGIELKEKTEQLAKQKLDNSDEKTPFQQYIEKRKKKMKEKKKEKLEARQKNNESSHSDSDIPSDIDMNDPYFAEEFRDSDFKKPRNRKQKIEDNDYNDEQKEAELELLLMNEVDDKRHFNLKNIQDNENTSNTKKKRKHKNLSVVTENPEDNFEVNTKDERFSALFTSHHFNIDPTDPRYKKTKAMETLVNEKIKRRLEDTDNSQPTNKKQKPISELNLLVKSVKRKAHAFKNRK